MISPAFAAFTEAENEVIEGGRKWPSTNCVADSLRPAPFTTVQSSRILPTTEGTNWTEAPFAAPMKDPLLIVQAKDAPSWKGTEAAAGTPSRYAVAGAVIVAFGKENTLISELPKLL